jgi:hypothetical protein
MKVDNYTNFVLTVIACALVILVFQQAFNGNSAFAWGSGSGIQKVAICDAEDGTCAAVFQDEEGAGNLCVAAPAAVAESSSSPFQVVGGLHRVCGA